MEFLDEDARPRFLFQARPNSSPASESSNEPHHSKLFICIAVGISLVLFSLSVFFIQSEPFRSLLIWISLSLLVGPFAPISITGGDIRVGQGPEVEFPDQEPEPEDDTKKRAAQRRSRARKSDTFGSSSAASENIGELVKEDRKSEILESRSSGNVVSVEEEKDWTEEDDEILKKQILKHPVGKPKRWEVIAEAFKGRHKLESVIKRAKELGEKKLDDGDSYAQFLKKRKPVDKRIESGNDELSGALTGKDSAGANEGVVVEWSSGEDIALLNGLKAFPKDVPMRWEKIAASVPGKSKAACMKRIAELKKGFRNAKAATEG